MSVPATTNLAPPRRPASTLLIVAVGMLMTMILVCGGGGAALLYLGPHRAEQALERIQRGRPPIASPGVADWMTSRVLAPVYTVALDAVASSEQVTERLGDAVGPAIDVDEMYRRTTSGELQGEETIEFDIQGEKGTAVVTAVASNKLDEDNPVAPIMHYQGYRTAKITVTFSDGTKIDVPPPKDQPAMEIR
jgi:hypothetical protein